MYSCDKSSLISFSSSDSDDESRLSGGIGIVISSLWGTGRIAESISNIYYSCEFLHIELYKYICR